MKKSNDRATNRPERGLYVPELESDACGTGFIAHLNGDKSHTLVSDALAMLANMHHRGACGSEENTGDGAGILVQLPHEFLTRVTAEHGFVLPAAGQYGAGMVFFPRTDHLRATCKTMFADIIDELGFDLLGFRAVPTDNNALGAAARATEPLMEQVFVAPRQPLERRVLERRLYVLRKFTHHSIQKNLPQAADDFYIASLSGQTIVYKGQLTATQVSGYFPDLPAPDFCSAIAVIHARFSTNTIPKWKLAQPFRYIAHNGEINTIRGNIAWWESKEPLLQSQFFSEEEIRKLQPICGKGLSDSAVFDNVLEFLTLAGRSMPHSLMMMIPEAWQHDPAMSDYKKAFYEYHAQLMEPWDGPASICFTDGVVVGALLDRNGLRPSRYCLTDDNVLIVASEAGALPVDQSKVVQKGRLQPGKILIADLDENRIIADEEVKKIICRRFHYRDWLSQNTCRLVDLPIPGEWHSADDQMPLQKYLLFGFTREDFQVLLKPTAETGEEPVGSMGADTPLAILSQQPQHLSHYFKQLFAQVTNPPIDPIRERLMMSLFSPLGGTKNPLDLDREHPRCIHLDSPVLGNSAMNRLKHIHYPHFQAGILENVFVADGQKGRLQAAIDQLCAAAEDFARKGCNLLIVSDRAADRRYAPIPSLLATGAVHQHLSKHGLRSHTAIIVEAGDVRETHHLAVLLGYGANAVNPYLSIAAISQLHREGRLEGHYHLEKHLDNYFKACDKGILKVLSKMGVSTVQSYIGAQLFEAVGIGPEVMARCFPGTVSRLDGLGFDDIADEVLQLHSFAFAQSSTPSLLLPHAGIYQWQRDGEAHTFNPQTIHLLQHAVRSGDFNIFKKYTKLIDRQQAQALTLRGLLGFRKGESIPLDEVEPVEQILRRFSTGAMSFGSLSHEAHANLAIAMNRIGAKSNSGEGGEDENRYTPLPNGDSMRSAIKQVASGRFGVTSWYLVNADELQIKMAQGAKPGEGGQLPGHKVDEWIAKVRHSTPGVGLISPPPHHDIYSIEDLAQLIFDLKHANPRARIAVKLVAKAGVGIIASGVAKAKADAIMISGHDGGTGASPLSAVRHAGLPWELGLAETHQVLVRNGLRARVRLQTDGQLRTGRDLLIATLLGAEEWSIATAALVAEGCIMMRKCHLNTCPVGIATQDPVLRQRFTGKPEHVINFFTFLAMELREWMAELGFRSVDEMVGRVEMLKPAKDIPEGKARLLDLSPLLFKETTWNGRTAMEAPKDLLSEALLAGSLDQQLIACAQPALDGLIPVEAFFAIANTDRAVGTLLSYEISRRWASEGLPEASISLHFRGSAGQSFGAFGAKGLKLRLEGEANDYFGKGLSGARLIAVPDRLHHFDPSANIIVGNVALMGATGGEAFVLGMAGERFAVRNSGAEAVVEGLGDHGCEYMTGGVVVVLGPVGRNFAAGMTGGAAFLYDPNQNQRALCNTASVELQPLDEADLQTVHRLLEAHLEYTGSERAGALLQSWESATLHFVKILPRDYQAVLKRQQPVKVAVA